MDYLTNQRSVLSKLRENQQIENDAGPSLLSFPEITTSSSGSNSIWSGSADGYPDGFNMRFPSLDDTIYLSELVDTTLLKVYLSVNEALVGSLVRIHNFCKIDETERLLSNRHVRVLLLLNIHLMSYFRNILNWLTSIIVKESIIKHCHF